MRTIIFFLLVLYSNQSFSQISRSDSIRKSYSWSSRNLFFEYSISGAILGEYYKTPKNEVWINNETKSNYQTWGLSLASFSVEPRVNMINIRDYASVSLNMPVNFSISFEDNGIGYFHFTLPLLLNLNLFYHSTYNNIVYKGLSFGIGAQYIAAPLFKTENFHYITSWIQPLLRFQYKFQNKSRNKGSSIGFRVGLLKGEYFRISFGKILFY